MQERYGSLDNLRNLMNELADPYADQFSIAAGPRRDNLERAFVEKEKIHLAIDRRTADFGEDEPSDEFGYAVGTVREMYYEEGEGYMFLADCESFGVKKDVAVLVWSYRNGMGGAAVLQKKG